MKKQTKLILCLTLAALLTLSACGGSAKWAREDVAYTTMAPTDPYNSYYNNYDGAYYAAEDIYYEAEYKEKADYAEKPTSVSATRAESQGEVTSSFVRQSDEKLVYTCRINMETLTFESTLSDIRRLISKYEGFIETEEQSDNANGWYYSDYRKTSGTLNEYIVIRIPTVNYDAFLEDLSGDGKITSKSQNVQNITTVYNDTATTITSLKTQEARLLEMMKEAKTIEEMLAIEDRLTDVQTELSIYESRLKGYDLDVAYSTITLNVREVLEYTPDVDPVKTLTFGDRLKNTLNDSWDNFTDFLEELLFFLIRAIPILIVVGGLIFLVVWIIVRSCKKSKAKKAARRAAPAATLQAIQNLDAEETK